MITLPLPERFTSFDWNQTPILIQIDPTIKAFLDSKEREGFATYALVENFRLGVTFENDTDAALFRLTFPEHD